MSNWNELSDEQKKREYDETMQDIAYCCIPWQSDFDEANGICPDCGRVTVGGKAICGCSYSPVECETCGAAPCDGSC